MHVFCCSQQTTAEISYSPALAVVPLGDLPSKISQTRPFRPPVKPRRYPTRDISACRTDAGLIGLSLVGKSLHADQQKRLTRLSRKSSCNLNHVFV
ncbi:hypothetical protein AFLA_005786 [Aspergillus flavus NRRL3357]|nr:hypothetical protein AFLA_005786 [Aspergillus flavus NRRL3357]